MSGYPTRPRVHPEARGTAPRPRHSPTVIRTEQAQLLGYVYVDLADRDIGSYVDEAKRVVGQMVKLPEGYSLEWSGQYEYMMRAKARLRIVIPVTLLYLDQAFERFKAAGRMNTLHDLSGGRRGRRRQTDSPEDDDRAGDPAN